ncbi:MAG: tRNA pseudouridine(54/55) synthase Pus10 [archaeon]|nr:tRNA pseudouridine(54/55) synthase Pus10 [archaeon]
MDFDLEMLEKAKKIADMRICDRCLGRQFAKCGTGMTNDLRGFLIREELNKHGYESRIDKPCPICEDIFDMLRRYSEVAAEAISSIESDNFLIGSRVEPEIVNKEKNIQESFKLENCESIKNELNREIGKLVLSMIHRSVEFKSPQVVACVDTRFADVMLDCSPIFIYGRYNKFSREIPQTVWPCRVCHGKGCSRCNNTGKMYKTSVQEIIGNIALEMTGGKEHFFHGMGREDIDARCLGGGRPFVLEVSQPRIRKIDLNELESRANQSGLAQYHSLKFVQREMVQKTKNATPTKIYSVIVRAKSKVNKDAINGVASSFKNVCLSQRTPQRVKHRRADLVRRRMVYWVKAINVGDNTFELTLETESGTYVKEFISGDEGRTNPNFSDAIGIACTVETLDVIAINEGSNASI